MQNSRAYMPMSMDNDHIANVQNCNISLSNTTNGTNTNRYVYVKHNLLNPAEITNSKVLINPHFVKKVFVNPNFKPLIQNTHNNVKENVKIHVNPNILRNIPLSLSNSLVKVPADNVRKKIEVEKEERTAIYHSRTKLIRLPAKQKNSKLSENVLVRKRRTSIHSKYKIVKSSSLHKTITGEKSKNTRMLLKTKYKLIKSKRQSHNSPQVIQKCKNRFKLDNRDVKPISNVNYKNKKFVYPKKFLSITEIARITPPKQNKNLSLVNIGGILYRKSRNCLRRTSTDLKKAKRRSILKVQSKTICKSKYKLIRKPVPIYNKTGNSLSKNSNKLKKSRPTKIRIRSVAKMKKCNIPCPYYRKFGKCKGKDNGKCSRKHDPDQIALCTKFLQGACIDEKCLLSHNVSPEKMPTCKFYLEGICSKDNCPYLHVRISPKADICRDFLEGFCKMATKCLKRHQFLCPDYEKNGNCLKQRCPYPHGRMVRKYSVFSKHKFAKKSSTNTKKDGQTQIKIRNTNITENLPTCSKFDNCNEQNIKTRYYAEQKVDNVDNTETSNQIQEVEDSDISDRDCGLGSRPKLGTLPSFIGFEES